MAEQSPSQTVGPFFEYGPIYGGEDILVNEQTSGERIRITGRVIDGEGAPVVDALIEIWQADANGIYNHPADPGFANVDAHFRGFGRSETVNDGMFFFKTIKPGAVAFDDSTLQAPHINVHVFARGMLIHAHTRLYFSDEAANDHDPVLYSIEGGRRKTLIAQRENGPDLSTYRLDIVLQGDNETVFFNP
ncbi:MAG: protocatechuate 3,4-dioxygenase subunit alpha [Chloroflexi bacterium]|nr:protocatechuate 3,4-dioxygenase subunit alpha [Chloroflexota bacterium]